MNYSVFPIQNRQIIWNYSEKTVNLHKIKGTLSYFTEEIFFVKSIIMKHLSKTCHGIYFLAEKNITVS